MNILITGAKGFIGKSLIAELKNRGFNNIFEYSKDTEIRLFDEYCKRADFVFHLAGINRPLNESEFMEGNYGFTSLLLDKLKMCKNKCPIVISSSIQVNLDNSYGKSKKASEDLLIDYGKETGAKVFIYRLPNVFGKWCKPNYNSVVATFCYNIANGLPITINDSGREMKLLYIDDLVEKFIDCLNNYKKKDDVFQNVTNVKNIKLSEIANIITSFKKVREEYVVPNMSDEFIKKLFSTYLSYLPERDLKYSLKMNVDKRGSFTEVIRTFERGQVSVNVSKPGIIKGNHWHKTKCEKFLVVNGKGIIRLRKIHSNEIVEYFVSADKMEVIDIPVGYTHNIENIGEADMVTLMWVNEPFNEKKPDTYFLEV